MCMMQKGSVASVDADRAYWEDEGWLANARPWK